MIKQGKNTIYCDSCKAEIPQKYLTIENKYPTSGVEEGIRIQFFRCNKCGVKYLIGVTDKETRIKQDELRRATKELKNLMENATDETLIKVEKVSRELYEKEEQLIKEIKSSMAELKKKYEGEL